MLVPATSIYAHPSISKADELQHNYCLKVVVFEVENQKRISEVRDAMFQKESEVITAIEKIRSDQDDAITAYKERLANEFATNIASIDRGNRETIKAAQDEYIATFDAVIADYRKAVGLTINARKEAYVNAEVAFVNRVDTVLAKTKSDCDNKVDAKEIFTYLTSELKLTYNTFTTVIGTLSTTVLSTLDEERLAVAKEAFLTKIDGVIQSYEN